MGRLRVGFLVDRWEPERGGAERCLALLARHLESRGHDVRAFAERAAAGAPGLFQRVRVTPGLGLLRGARERTLAHALVGAARDAGCDVTVGIRHLPRVDLFWPHAGAHGGELEARGRMRGRPLAPWGRHRVFLELERELVAGGGARAIVCVSELVRDELLRFHPGVADRLHLVPNGVDLQRFHPGLRETVGAELRARLDVAPAAPLLAFVGRDPVLKGLPQLLRALSRLADVRWHLVAAGPRHPARWRRIASRLGLGPGRVTVEPSVPAPDLLSAADLLVVPTWRDTSLLALLEALATGTPVVTTRFAGEARLLEPHAGTVLDDPGDVEGLAEALRAWLARVRAGEVERSALRALVASRGVGPWLARLEELVVGLAR